MFNLDRPDGAPRTLLDVSSCMGWGWQASIGLREGLEATSRWYVEQLATGSMRAA